MKLEVSISIFHDIVDLEKCWRDLEMSLNFTHHFLSKPCGQNVCPNIIVIVFYSIVINIYSTKGMFVHVLFWLLLHS